MKLYLHNIFEDILVKKDSQSDRYSAKLDTDYFTCECSQLQSVIFSLKNIIRNPSATQYVPDCDKNKL